MEKISEELLNKILEILKGHITGFEYISIDKLKEDFRLQEILEESTLEKARNLGFYLSKPGNIYVMKTNIIVENIELLIKYYEQVIKELQEKYEKEKKTNEKS